MAEQFDSYFIHVLYNGPPIIWGGRRYTPHLMYTHTCTYINVELCDLAKLLALPVRFWIPVALRIR